MLPYFPAATGGLCTQFFGGRSESFVRSIDKTPYGCMRVIFGPYCSGRVPFPNETRPLKEQMDNSM